MILVCPECESAEDLRLDTTTGDLDCVNCGVVVVPGPYGEPEDE